MAKTAGKRKRDDPAGESSSNKDGTPATVLSSVYVGVVWDKNLNKWKSRVMDNGRKIHVGYFINEVEAARKYDQVAETIANKPLNFPTLPGQVKAKKNIRANQAARNHMAKAGATSSSSSSSITSSSTSLAKKNAKKKKKKKPTKVKEEEAEMETEEITTPSSSASSANKKRRKIKVEEAREGEIIASSSNTKKSSPSIPTTSSRTTRSQTKISTKANIKVKIKVKVVIKKQEQVAKAMSTSKSSKAASKSEVATSNSKSKKGVPEETVPVKKQKVIASSKASKSKTSKTRKTRKTSTTSETSETTKPTGIAPEKPLVTDEEDEEEDDDAMVFPSASPSEAATTMSVVAIIITEEAEEVVTTDDGQTSPTTVTAVSALDVEEMFVKAEESDTCPPTLPSQAAPSESVASGACMSTATAKESPTSVIMDESDEDRDHGGSGGGDDDSENIQLSSLSAPCSISSSSSSPGLPFYSDIRPQDRADAREFIMKAFDCNQSASSPLNFSSASASWSSKEAVPKMRTEIAPSSSSDGVALDTPDFMFLTLANADEESRRRRERSASVADMIEEAVFACAVAEGMSKFEYSAKVDKTSSAITSDKLMRAKTLSGEMSAVQVAREIKMTNKTTEVEDEDMPHVMTSDLLPSGVHFGCVL